MEKHKTAIEAPLSALMLVERNNALYRDFLMAF